MSNRLIAIQSGALRNHIEALLGPAQVSTSVGGSGHCWSVSPLKLESVIEHLPTWQKSADVALLDHWPDIRQPGLLVMDMDSTVIDMECIDELAHLVGAGEEVTQITEQAMRGELDFAQSLRARVLTLAGADASIIAQVIGKMRLNPGVEKLVSTLKSHGWIVAIASGGFTAFAEHLQTKLGLSHVLANELEVVDGRLSGEVVGAIVDAHAKAAFVKNLAAQYDIAMQQTLAIGDGANDLPMLIQASLGVAFRAKPVVAAKADMQLNFNGLDAVLTVMGD